MTGYRLFLLGPAGGFVGVHSIMAKDDAEAMEVADWYPAPHGGEVWQQSRFIGIVPRITETGAQAP